MENLEEKKESWLTPCDATPISVDTPVCTVDELAKATDADQVTQGDILSELVTGLGTLNEEIKTLRMVQQAILLTSVDLEVWQYPVGGYELSEGQRKMLLALMERLGLPIPFNDAKIDTLDETVKQAFSPRAHMTAANAFLLSAEVIDDQKTAVLKALQFAPAEDGDFWIVSMYRLLKHYEGTLWHPEYLTEKPRTTREKSDPAVPATLQELLESVAPPLVSIP